MDDYDIEPVYREFTSNNVKLKPLKQAFAVISSNYI